MNRFDKRLPTLGIFLLLSVFSTLSFATRDGAAGRGVITRSLASELPLRFEINEDQFPAPARFGARGENFLALLSTDSITLRWADRNADPLRLTWAEGNRNPEIVTEGTSKSLTSYFRGNDPSRWHSGVATVDRIRYREIYPGIDLLVHGQRGYLEYDLVLSAGADPEQIRLAFRGPEALELKDERTQILMELSTGTVTQHIPKIFQYVQGQKKLIQGKFRLLEDQTVAFELGSYDPGLELTIDPVLRYSSYLGGSRGDVPRGVATDDEGNFYIMGSTGSEDFPVLGAFQPEFGGGGFTNGDLYVTKLDPSGQEVIYSTYIGGEGTDVGRGLAVDSQGRAYVVGTTFSDDFPFTQGAFQTTCSGQCPFVVKLSATGDALEYATFVGRGDGLDIAVNSSGEATLVGRTSSNTYPVTNAFQPNRAGMFDAVVSTFNAAGSDLIFSSFLGGSGDESLNGRMAVTVDNEDNILVAGTTVSDDFPKLNPIQSSRQGEEDLFLTKVNASGQLLFSTYLGGTEDDNAWDVATDSNRNVYVTGETKSTDFPTANSFQSEYGGGIAIGDAFLTKVPPEGGSVLFSTFLGGSGGDRGSSLAVDALDRAVLVGTGAAGFPLENPLLEFEGVNSFVLKIEEDGSGLVYSTAFGGGDSDIAVAVRVTDVYLAGNSSSGSDPILNALQPRRKFSTETYFAQISDAGEIYFAQFGNGPGAVSDILLTNSSLVSTATATLQFRDDDGLPVELDLTVSDTPAGLTSTQAVTSELTVQIEPLGVVKVSTDGQGDDLVAGSVTVAHDMPIGGVIRFNLDPFGTAGVGESQLVRGFITPARNTTIRTGVAIHNPEDSQTGVRMTLRNRAGERIPGGLTTTAIPAKGHLARFIDELFRSADLENFEGTLTVEATSLNALIAATALELGTQPGQFTTLPVTPIP